MQHEQIKYKIQEALLNKLCEIKNVISVTIVGSFVNNKDLYGISDIDTIVITKSLNKKIFDSCYKAVSNIDLKNCGLNNYKLKINTTFGPLKFDKPNLAVVHLMIYDIKSHRYHVIKSPFTCFDWERSNTRIGLSLKEIFPVGILQFRDFMEVRRSLENYIDDLEQNVISYREYYFDSNKTIEIKKNKPMDTRHSGEYSYHIVRNLISNYLKLNNQKNNSYSSDDIKKEIKRLFYDKSNYYEKKFNIISTIKSKRENNFPEDILMWTKLFLNDFQKMIKTEWRDAIAIYFIRHYKTKLNDGTFLGQGRNPGIDKSINYYIDYQPQSIIHCSPMLRCIETAKSLSSGFKIMKDDRLHEYNYGFAEGLCYDELVNKYPKISSDWENGKDPYFPGGENTRDVFNRLKSFLKDLAKELDSSNNKKPKYIVTHNGVLRCLLGDAFGLNLKDWYKLEIPHGVSLEFLYHNQKFYPNIPREICGEIMQKIGYSSA